MKDGEVVIPSEIENGESVSCRSCGAKMYARDGENRARHFYHVDSEIGEVCPSNKSSETAIHGRCVAFAVEALRDGFESAECGAEVEISVSEGQSGHEVRRADAVAQFSNSHDRFGEGLIIEVQHKNYSKKPIITSHDYLSAGYSVVWVSSDVFEESGLDFSFVEEALDRNSENAFAIENYNPDQFWNCESYLHGGDHYWQIVPEYVSPTGREYEICASRPCALRRQYDDEKERYVYRPQNIVSVSEKADLRRYQDAFVDKRNPNPDSGDIINKLERSYEVAVLEKALADRSEIGPCSGPLGVHEWGKPKSLWDGASPVELRACKNCSAHLYTDTRGYPKEHTTIIFERPPDSDWDLMSLQRNPRNCDDKIHEKDGAFGHCSSCGLFLSGTLS